MAIQYLTIADVCEQLKWFADLRDRGLHIVAASDKVGASAATAAAYEAAINQIRSPKTDAAPRPGHGQGAAENPAPTQ